MAETEQERYARILAEREAFECQFPGWLSQPVPQHIEERCGWPAEPTPPARSRGLYDELGD